MFSRVKPYIKPKRKEMSNDEVIKLLNNTCGKSVEKIWITETVDQHITNCLKHINTDSGGTNGSVPQRFLDLADKYIKLSRDELASELYRHNDERNQSIRIGLIKRLAAIRTKTRRCKCGACGIGEDGLLRIFIEILSKMINQTLDHGNKRTDRLRIANHR